MSEVTQTTTRSVVVMVDVANRHFGPGLAERGVTRAGPSISLRFRINVGSRIEQSDERGIAHFLEHMAFRGSTHYPDGSVPRYVQPTVEGMRSVRVKDLKAVVDPQLARAYMKSPWWVT